MAKRISDKRRKAIMDIVLEGLMNGNSLSEICSAEDVPNRSTIIRWGYGDDELASAIARARELRAEALDEDTADVIQEIRSGKLDANAGRVIIWANQWRAARMNPKRYGDKIDHKHSGNLVIGIRQNERVEADDE